MIWFIIWVIGCVVFFFIPMLFGAKMDENEFGAFTVAVIAWPLVLLIAIPFVLLVEGVSKLSKLITRIYFKTSDKMGKYWDSKRKFKAEG